VHSDIIMGLFKSLTSLFRRERTVAQLAKWLDVPETELREWLVKLHHELNVTTIDGPGPFEATSAFCRSRTGVRVV